MTRSHFARHFAGEKSKAGLVLSTEYGSPANKITDPISFCAVGRGSADGSAGDRLDPIVAG